MKKEKINLFEKIDINDPDYAQCVYDKETQKFKLKLICGGVSLLTTIAWICINAFGMNSIAANITGIFIPIGIIAAVLSSPKSILSTAWKIIKICYNLVPFALFDLIAALIGAIFAIYLFFWIPAVYCAVGLYQSYKNKKDAETFLVHKNVMSQQNNIQQ